MNSPIRILQVFTIMDMGGAETMIMNYYRNIDRSKVQFDFLVHRTQKGAYEDEIEALGGHIYRISPLFNLRTHIKDIQLFFNQHSEYKIIHGHVGILGYYLYKEAEKKNIPTIIAHAHNNACDFSWRWPLWNILRFLIRSHYTHAMTCGASAAVWTFGRKKASKAILMKNAIDAQKYTFNIDTRHNIRERYGWEDHFVVGNVARFEPQKNHMGLLKIFQELLNKQPNALLVLVGNKSGLFNDVYARVKELGIEKSVQFLGACTNIPELMQGMDVFCFPSHYEGFGIVLLEAQAAGLHTVKSSKVPEDAVAVPQLVSTCSLSDSPKEWSNQLLKKYTRINTYHDIVQAGFDITSNAIWLQQFYLNLHQSCTPTL